MKRENSATCTTEYAVVGAPDEVQKLHAYIMQKKAPENASGNIRGFFNALRDWSISVSKKGTDVPHGVYFTLETKESPKHEYVGTLIQTVVGHKMKVYYNSWCVEKSAYSTNDKEGVMFTPSKYVWDYEGQDDFTSLQEILERAKKTFGRAFASVDDVNEYAQENFSKDVIYPYSFAEPNLGLEETEEKTFRVVYIKTICKEEYIKAKDHDEAKAKWEAEGDDADLFFIEDEFGQERVVYN